MAICAWVASAVAWTRAIASACSVGGGTAAAGAKGVVGIAAVTFPPAAGSREKGGAVLLGLGEQFLKFFHVFVGAANFAPFAACFGEKSGIRDQRVECEEPEKTQWGLSHRRQTGFRG